MKFPIILFSIFFIISCTLPDGKSEQRLKYEYIEINKMKFLIKKSDSAYVNKIIDRSCFMENTIANNLEPKKNDHLSLEKKEERKIIKRGLKLSHFKKIKNGLFLEYHIVLDSTGRTVLSRIIDTNVELSIQEEFNIHLRILDTKAEPDKAPIQCARIRIKPTS